MLPIITKLPSGKYVQVLEELPDCTKVREWNFDEQYNAIPTNKIYNIPKRRNNHIMLKSPCSKDCPRRKSGCAITCPDWKTYTEERQKVYDQRKNDVLIKAENGVYKTRIRKSKQTVVTENLSEAVKHAYGIEEEI